MLLIGAYLGFLVGWLCAQSSRDKQERDYPNQPSEDSGGLETLERLDAEDEEAAWAARKRSAKKKGPLSPEG
jgi:hypothetical protein